VKDPNVVFSFGFQFTAKTLRRDINSSCAGAGTSLSTHKRLESLWNYAECGHSSSFTTPAEVLSTNSCYGASKETTGNCLRINYKWE